MDNSTLTLPDKSALAGELTLSQAVDAERTQALEQQAEQIVGDLLALGERDLVARTERSRALSQLGQDVMRLCAERSQLLKAPMSELMQDAEDGSAISNGLLKFQEQASSINPNKYDFNMGGLRRLLSKLPGVGTPLSRWFAKYQLVSQVIDDIVAMLKDGQAQLARDNTTLRNDQQRARETTFVLQDIISLGQQIDAKLAAHIDSLSDTDERKPFLQEECQFGLRQQIQDQQQLLLVTNQAVMTAEVGIRTNRELIRGVERCLNTTVVALETAASQAVMLQRQKKVLKGVQAASSLTEDLIAQNAQVMKQQTAEVQRQASSTQLDIDKLKVAFADVEEAFNSLSQFRLQALPKMASEISEMNDIAAKQEATISKMERGEQIADEFQIKVSTSVAPEVQAAV